MERVELEALPKFNALEDVKANDVHKIVKHFGTQTGCNATCRRLIRALCKDKEYLPGDVVSINEVLFTLMKHLLLSDRKNSPPLNEEVGRCVGCSCCSKTYFMPMGCDCKRVKIYNQKWLPASLRSQMLKMYEMLQVPPRMYIGLERIKTSISNSTVKESKIKAHFYCHCKHVMLCSC